MATAKKKTVDDYARGLPPAQKLIVAALRKIVLQPGVTESIKWSQPVYESNGPFCYVRAFTKTVNFGFWRGAELMEQEPRLESGGKRMAHIKLATVKDVDARSFKALVKAAIALNASEGDPTKRSTP